MKCPICNAYTEIKDSRVRKDNTVVRKRLCFNMHTFQTREVVTMMAAEKSSATPSKPTKILRKAPND